MLLSRLGYEFIWKGREFKNFIPFHEHLRGAKEAGLSIGEYIDARYNVPGATQKTLEKIWATH